MKKIAKKGPKVGTAVVKKETGLPKKISDGSLDLQALFVQAIAKGDVDTAERLVVMRKEMKAEAAKEAYFDSLAGFQSECPIVHKSKKVMGKAKDGKPAEKKYSYAPIEDILAFREGNGPTIKELLKKWGFSYIFKSKQGQNLYTAICVAHHRLGHEESTEFTVPTSFPEYMNLSGAQEQGASCTYADRYAFKNAFGITTKGEDNDAPQQGDKREPIRPTREREEAVPVAHEEVKRNDFDEILFLLASTSLDPKTKMTVKLFSENETIDYKNQATMAKDNPEELRVILKDVVETGKKRHRAVKGETS